MPVKIIEVYANSVNTNIFCSFTNTSEFFCFMILSVNFLSYMYNCHCYVRATITVIATDENVI